MPKTKSRRSVRRTRKARTYISKRKAIRRAKRSNFVRNVKQVIQSLTETKEAYTTSGNSSLTMFNSAIDSTGDMMAIMPSIAQGVKDNERIGDQVRGQSLNIRGHIKLNINAFDALPTATDLTKLPSVVARLMIVSLKSKPSYLEAVSSSAPLATLLKKGGTTVAFTGVLSDIYAPINTDAWTVHADRKFYLNQSFVNTLGTSAPSTVIAQDIKNTVKFFNLRVRCKKLMKYDEDVSSGLYPTNFGPMLLLGYSYLSGETPDSGLATPQLGLQYDAVFRYEDA